MYKIDIPAIEIAGTLSNSVFSLLLFGYFHKLLTLVDFSNYNPKILLNIEDMRLFFLILNNLNENNFKYFNN